MSAHKAVDRCGHVIYSPLFVLKIVYRSAFMRTETYRPARPDCFPKPHKRRSLSEYQPMQAESWQGREAASASCAEADRVPLYADAQGRFGQWRRAVWRCLKLTELLRFSWRWFGEGVVRNYSGEGLTGRWDGYRCSISSVGGRSA